MIPREVIKKILEAGIQAPSGENSQPWRFKIEGDRVLLFNRPEADRSLYNFRQNGSLVAHGALLENVRIAARAQGYEAVIALFPGKDNEDLVATIDLKQATPEIDPLFGAIEKRLTNRKKYDASPLGEHVKKELLADAVPGVRLVLVEDREAIAQLAKAASVNETMLVLNKRVHDFFFSHVRWTPEENKIQPNGFYVKTLELNAQQAKGFKLLRNWGAARILGTFGMAKVVGRDNETIFRTASAMIGVVVRDNTPRNLVLAGQSLERVWLTATKLGLSVQPSTGALFLAEGITGENRDSFSEDQRTDLEAARRTIYKTLGVDQGREHVAVIFRVGRSEPASAHAARFPLEAFLDGSAMQEERLLPKLAADRRATIDHVLNDLATLKNDPGFPNQYAVGELIAFFRAIRSVSGYMRWLIRRAPKLDRTRLLELTDLPFPRWDIEMHRRLIEVESQNFPGLIKPLVGRLFELASEKQKGTFIGINLGSGGMEVDRQVIKKLLDQGHPGRVVLVGVDKSPVTHDLAKENLSELRGSVTLREIEHLDRASLELLIKEEKGQYIVVLCKNDIFKLAEHFGHRQFDVAYHSLFRHHLDDAKKNEIGSVMKHIARHCLEYDGYKNWHILLPQGITAWKTPVFLNAGVFSEFRYSTKTELRAKHADARIPFYPNLGTYLFEERVTN